MNVLIAIYLFASDIKFICISIHILRYINIVTNLCSRDTVNSEIDACIYHCDFRKNL